MLQGYHLGGRASGALFESREDGRSREVDRGRTPAHQYTPVGGPHKRHTPFYLFLNCPMYSFLAILKYRKSHLLPYFLPMI
ncbi:hypothetical protein BJ165DRAFT_199185 [Panaeolus papilionaceus]|nr:hypothetical protein BJ165DRAFT_199185 [Panaeolus papilionaceus]